LIGYRQTVGAKKERIISANAEIEKILVRRIVLESFTPSIIDLSRLLEGKARDFRVKVGDLLSESQVLNSIYTRIIETDLLTQAQRQEVLTRLVPLVAEAENSLLQEETIIGTPTVTKRNVLKNILAPLSIGAITSILGSILSAIPNLNEFALKNSDKEIFSHIIALSGLSFAIIATIVMFNRLRESQQETSISSRSSAIEQAINFEREVAKHIEKQGLAYKPAGPQDQGYDFETIHNGKKILIEVKAWSRQMPMGLVSRVVDRLNEAVENENASEGIIVTKNLIDISRLEDSSKKISVFNLAGFKDYLSKNN